MKDDFHDSTFRNFFVNTTEYSPAEIFGMYNDPYSSKTIKQISEITNKSIGEIYRVIHKYGGPNRQGKNHHLIHTYASQGVPIQEIANLTGYTQRGVRNILQRKQHVNHSN